MVLARIEYLDYLSRSLFKRLDDLGEKGFKNKIKQNKVGYDQCSLTRKGTRVDCLH